MKRACDAFRNKFLANDQEKGSSMWKYFNCCQFKAKAKCRMLTFDTQRQAAYSSEWTMQTPANWWSMKRISQGKGFATKLPFELVTRSTRKLANTWLQAWEHISADTTGMDRSWQQGMVAERNIWKVDCQWFLWRTKYKFLMKPFVRSSWLLEFKNSCKLSEKADSLAKSSKLVKYLFKYWDKKLKQQAFQ